LYSSIRAFIYKFIPFMFTLNPQIIFNDYPLKEVLVYSTSCNKYMFTLRVWKNEVLTVLYIIGINRKSL